MFVLLTVVALSAAMGMGMQCTRLAAGPRSPDEGLVDVRLDQLGHGIEVGLGGGLPRPDCPQQAQHNSANLAGRISSTFANGRNLLHSKSLCSYERHADDSLPISGSFAHDAV
jgi:hypothetical protein